MKIYNYLSDKNLINFLRENKDFTFLHFTGSMLGIGAPVNSKVSIDKIGELKKRTDAKGYIILIPGADWLADLHMQPNKTQRRLIQQYWPGELTLIFDDTKKMFPDLTINDRIAVRVPGDPFLRRFIEILGIPVISTSINISGQEPVNDLNLINSEYSDWFDFKLIPKNWKPVSGEGSTIADINNDKLSILREGSLKGLEISESAEKPLILFVCTGNICRSPMAEYYAREFFKKEALPVRTLSAGFLESGNRISENSRIVLLENNIDADIHRSFQINEDLIRKSWLILTMETRHKTELIRMDPNIEGKVFTLSEYCGSEFCQNSLDIADPYGLDLYNYRLTFDLIKARVECLAELIKKEV